MVFPKTDYISFYIVSTNPTVFTFDKKRPKKLWFDVSSDNVSFRIKINDDDESGLLIHMSRSNSKEITIPSTVNKITLTTTIETSYQISLLVEEWEN